MQLIAALPTSCLLVSDANPLSPAVAAARLMTVVAVVVAVVAVQWQKQQYY